MIPSKVWASDRGRPRCRKPFEKGLPRVGDINHRGRAAADPVDHANLENRITEAKDGVANSLLLLVRRGAGAIQGLWPCGLDD